MKITRSSVIFVACFLSFGASVLHSAEPAAVPAKASTPVAKVGTVILTEEDMRKDMGMNLYEAENQLYQIKKGWVDQKVKNVLFDQAAKEAGLSRAAWQARDIEGKITPPSQQEIDQLAPRFAAQGSTVPPVGADLAKLKDQAKQYLEGQKRTQQENMVYQQLLAKNPVDLLFTKPEAPRIDVTYAADDPVKGPKNAPVTIVEFTDFQCPFCKRSQDALRQIESVYADKVKLVARQYPLPFHNRAKPAAEAALCALEQGKFWEMRDKLFDKQELSDADFTRYAKEIGLKEKKFAACLAEHKYAARIDGDIADGQRFGVRGTPHFFINGTPISGAQPFENFKSVIDDELAKKKS